MFATSFDPVPCSNLDLSITSTIELNKVHASCYVTAVAPCNVLWNENFLYFRFDYNHSNKLEWTFFPFRFFWVFFSLSGVGSLKQVLYYASADELKFWMFNVFSNLQYLDCSTKHVSRIFIT